MRFVPRSSVGTQLTAAVFMAILLSWVVSSGVSSYVAYQRVRALRQEMLRRPDLYPRPIPEPRFGVRDFLLGPEFGLGRPPEARPGPHHGPPPVGRPVPPDVPALGDPPGPLPNPLPARRPAPVAMLVARIGVGLLLAVATGALLSRRFSRRLGELASGAKAFDSGDLGHRVPQKGDDEFARVAAAMNQMAETVSGQISRLEEDAKRRRQFLADVAHELRGPVTTIRTMAGAMADGVADDPERKERAMNSLVRSSDHLLHIVGDLLDLARLDLKELPIHREPTDLTELTKAALDAHSPAAAAAGITLHPLEVEGQVTAEVDAHRFTQVLDNLLDNAISHAGGGAEVRVKVEGGDPVRVTVADNGRGIPAEHLPYVFEPFYRADPARTPSQGHSGLGLRISQGLVEAHGGTLTLTSTEGAGTTVTIEIPRRHA